MKAFAKNNMLEPLI